MTSPECALPQRINAFGLRDWRRAGRNSRQTLAVLNGVALQFAEIFLKLCLRLRKAICASPSLIASEQVGLVKCNRLESPGLTVDCSTHIFKFACLRFPSGAIRRTHRCIATSEKRFNCGRLWFVKFAHDRLHRAESTSPWVRSTDSFDVLLLIRVEQHLVSVATGHVRYGGE